MVLVLYKRAAKQRVKHAYTTYGAITFLLITNTANMVRYFVSVTICCDSWSTVRRAAGDTCQLAARKNTRSAGRFPVRHDERGWYAPRGQTHSLSAGRCWTSGARRTRSSTPLPHSASRPDPRTCRPRLLPPSNSQTGRQRAHSRRRQAHQINQCCENNASTT